MYQVRNFGTEDEPLINASAADRTEITENRTKIVQSRDTTEIFPLARWTKAIQDAKRRQFPQAIAHRGYKALYPENTMTAFRAAIEAGAHAIETDIHLSKDGVVVLSHDPTLKRCFGKLDKIIDCDWNYLQQQRTIRLPHEAMPRLSELLELLAQPQNQEIWMLFDIKISNKADDVMRLIAETLKSVNPGVKQWHQRIVLGIWAARYLPLCNHYLPGFAVTHIGFSTSYSRQFLDVPNISFNVLQRVLFGPIGTRFIREVKRADRPVYLWTVNNDKLMRWCIQQGVDGVITDDPRKFKEMCRDWSGTEPVARPSVSQMLYTFFVYILLAVFYTPAKRRVPESLAAFRARDGDKGGALRDKGRG